MVSEEQYQKNRKKTKKTKKTHGEAGGIWSRRHPVHVRGVGVTVSAAMAVNEYDYCCARKTSCTFDRPFYTRTNDPRVVLAL